MIKLMKTMLLLAITAVVALTSCSQDVTLEDVIAKTEPRQEIEFHLDMQSRATDRTINNLDTIWVYADDGLNIVFETTPFIKDEYGRFLPEEKIYWPDSLAKINFTAFWPNPKLLEITTLPGQTTVNYSMPVTSDHHFDLISANTTIEKVKYSKGIPLSFAHVFAQIEFRAKIEESATHSLEIYAIGVSRLKQYGVFNLSTNDWKIGNQTSNCYAFPDKVFTVKQEALSMTDKTGPMYVIPQMLQSNVYNASPAVTGRSYLILYLKAFDENANLFYPLEEWKNDEQLSASRIAPKTTVDRFMEYRNLEGCGVTLSAVLDNDMQLLAGHKYIITIDFTNGIGYFNGNDPEKPTQPVIPNAFNAYVSVEEWSSTDIDQDSN